MKWLKAIALVLGAIVVIAVIVPFFVTLNDYIPELEKELSARLGKPVSIDELHAALLPVPHATIDGITIGSADDIQVGKVTLTPDAWTLLRQDKVIRTVELEDVTLTQEALGALAGLAQSDRGSGAIRVENVELRNAQIKLERSVFGPFDVHVRVSHAPTPGLVTLKTRDGALEVKAIPEAERFSLELHARKWTPPVGPAFVFDALDVKGVVRNKSAEFGDIDAKAYGGTIGGTVTIAWDKGIAVKGNLDLEQIELQQPVALLSPKTRVSGKLDAKPVFSAHAAKAEQLDDTLRVESPFVVHDGVLHGFDIVAAATTLGKETRGGETRFEQLQGRLLLDRRSYRFSDLRIASGALSARGSVTISPSKALGGQISASATALGRTLAVPLSVTGTLDSPMLLPNASALAGAAAGTLIAPGIGTAAGAKVGEVLEGLFGKGKK
jgi:hypothetical protein